MRERRGEVPQYRDAVATYDRYLDESPRTLAALIKRVGTARLNDNQEWNPDVARKVRNQLVPALYTLTQRGLAVQHDGKQKKWSKVGV